MHDPVQVRGGDRTLGLLGARRTPMRGDGHDGLPGDSDRSLACWDSAGHQLMFGRHDGNSFMNCWGHDGAGTDTDGSRRCAAGL